MSHLVQFGTMPAALPIGLVEDLQNQTDGSGLLQFKDELQTGDPVRLTGGAFDGWIGKVRSVNARGRVEVLLELLSREIPVVVNRAQLLHAT